MNPLNPFPQFLTYSFFAPLMLRAACCFFLVSLAIKHYDSRDGIEKLFSTFLGKYTKPSVFLMIGFEIITAFMIALGWYTQIAAIFGMIIALKFIIIRPRILSPYGNAALWLMLVMCISLILTGGGSFALDIPL